MLKNQPAKTGDEGRRCKFNPWVKRSPGEENDNPLQYSCPWEIPWTEESGRLQSVGSQRVRHDLVSEHMRAHTHTLTHSHLVA